eukprot:4744474-Ditylum_brightwellii.AAC.1
MDDMPTAKRLKMYMSMNTIGPCKTKENILEIIANWLLLSNHNFMVSATTLPLLYGAFFTLADLITSQDYKNRHEQSSQYPSPDQESNDRKTFDPAPFVYLYNAASDLVRNIE